MNEIQADVPLKPDRIVGKKSNECPAGFKDAMDFGDKPSRMPNVFENLV